MGKIPQKHIECFRLLFEHLVWIKHEFLSGIRHSGKAWCLWGIDERCGRSKEVRTPELIGQIKIFLDKDRRVTIEAISLQFDVSVGTVHIIIREEVKMRKIVREVCPKSCSEKIRKKDVVITAVRWSSWSILDPAVLDALVICDESWIFCYDPETKWQGSQWKHAGSARPKKAWQSKSTHQHLMNPFFWHNRHDPTNTGFPLDRQSTRNTMLRFLREFSRRFRRKRPALFKSGQWHFHQYNAPVHNSIPATDYLTKMCIKAVPHPHYSLDLVPCDLCLFPKLKEKLIGCRYETIEEMKEALTKVIDMITQEDFHGAFQQFFGTVQQVHCNRWRLLRSGQQFHVCIINKKSPYEKKCGKLI